MEPQEILKDLRQTASPAVTATETRATVQTSPALEVKSEKEAQQFIDEKEKLNARFEGLNDEKWQNPFKSFGPRGILKGLLILGAKQVVKFALNRKAALLNKSVKLKAAKSRTCNVWD